MTRWEYKTVTVRLSTSNGGTKWEAHGPDFKPTQGLDEIANEFGAQGWDLITAVVTAYSGQPGETKGHPMQNATRLRLLFKRPVSQASELAESRTVPPEQATRSDC